MKYRDKLCLDCGFKFIDLNDICQSMPCLYKRRDTKRIVESAFKKRDIEVKIYAY